MAAGEVHVDMTPSAGGNNHVPQMRNENYQGMDRIMDLGNREVTAVYQRRQKKQAVAEHATAVTVESFYRII